MKAICTVVGNAVFDGDVIFLNKSKCDAVFAVHIEPPNKAIATSRGFGVYSKMPRTGFKLKALWVLHMIILRKSHVYLTGVIK